MAEPLDAALLAAIEARADVNGVQIELDIRALLTEVRRLRLLLAEMAAVPPVTDTASGPACCLYCDQDAPRDGWEGTGWHAPDCPWRRAAEVR